MARAHGSLTISCTRILFARAAFEEEVVQEVHFEIPSRDNVSARPWIAHRIDRQGGLTAGDEMVTVASVDRSLERSSVGVFRGIAVRTLGGAAKEEIDRSGDQFNVAVLFGGDVRDKIEVGTEFRAAAEVETLKGVVHERGHLTELSAH